uniref:Thioredoxin domain-containing protein n=2 Tax=Ciona intestinalis TaxID=7719 RepID=H2XTK8_CIOIN
MIDHQNTKDTLVYHHSPYCGFCSQYSHQLISFKRLLRGVRNLDIVSVSSDTNSQLPLTFQAISFPTLMFYPANRSSDSTRYPPHVQLTPSKLMGFLWHYASPLTKLQIVVALCDDHSTSKQYSCFSAFMENLEICKLTGIMKSMRKEIVRINMMEVLAETIRGVVGSKRCSVPSLSSIHQHHNDEYLRKNSLARLDDVLSRRKFEFNLVKQELSDVMLPIV